MCGFWWNGRLARTGYFISQSLHALSAPNKKITKSKNVLEIGLV